MFFLQKNAAAVIFGDWKFIFWQAYNSCTVESLLRMNQDFML